MAIELEQVDWQGNFGRSRKEIYETLFGWLPALTAAAGLRACLVPWQVKS